MTDLPNPRRTLLWLALAASALAPALAQAQTMSASGTYSFGGNPVATLGPSVFPFNPNVDVLLFTGAGSNSVGMHTYGSLSGNFGSRSSGQGVYDVTGTYNITESISNPGAAPLAATMNFNITPGMLMNTLNSSTGAGEFVSAYINFDIRVNGSPVWGSNATLRTDSTGTSFSSGGTNLYGLSAPGYYTIAGGAFSANLGTIAAGGSISLSYTLSTATSGNSAGGPGVFVPEQTFHVPDQWVSGCQRAVALHAAKQGAAPDSVICDPTPVFVAGHDVVVPAHTQFSQFSGVNGSHASSGDPFTIDTTSGAPIFLGVRSSDPNGLHFTTSPVPEPAHAALLLAGLGWLGWRSRRRA